MAPTTIDTGDVGSSNAYIADPAMFELEQRFGIALLNDYWIIRFIRFP